VSRPRGWHGTHADRRAGAASGHDPRALARDGLLELGYAPVEADELLAQAEGETAEQLIAGALRLARAGS